MIIWGRNMRETGQLRPGWPLEVCLYALSESTHTLRSASRASLSLLVSARSTAVWRFSVK